MCVRVVAKLPQKAKINVFRKKFLHYVQALLWPLLFKCFSKNPSILAFEAATANSRTDFPTKLHFFGFWSIVE